MQRSSIRSILALGAIVGSATSVAVATPPPFTITSLAHSGNTITGLGAINQINQFPGGRGFFSQCVNTSGSWLIDADTQHAPTSLSHEGILETQPIGGTFTPYLAQGIEGFLSVPTPTAVVTTFLNMAMNNAGNAAFAISWAPDDFSDPAGSAVIDNNNKVVFLQGDLAVATGLAAGAVWNAPDANTSLRLNDNNLLLVVSTVTETAVIRRVVMTIQLDASGNVLTRTLLAKEGGPVGAGPATWASLASGPHSASINNAGTAVFSGTTSTGIIGIFSTAGSGAFVAVAGGPTPVAGINWGSLLGAAVDINNPGAIAFNAPTASGSGTFAEFSAGGESGDGSGAGDTVDHENHTYGNGPLNLITGTLSNDQDVDMYRIVVTDPANFSATTVPDPASGFTGAAFDSVLTLINEPGNGQRGMTQSDDVSATINQSRITGTVKPPVAGYTYYLAISTPKSRCGGRAQYYATNSYPTKDLWQSDPAGVAVSGGLVYWPIPSAGTIRRATTTGVIQSDLSAPSVTPYFGLDGAGGKVYWVNQSANDKIRRSNLDGSSVEDLVTNNNFGDIAVYDTSGLAVDAANGHIYWTRAVEGEINRTDLDGSNPTRIIRDYPPTGSAFPAATTTGTFAPEAIAIDTTAGPSNKIYWINTFTNAIERCNLDGTGRAAFIVGAGPAIAGASGIAIDSAAGKIYWTSTTAGKIQRASLDGTGAIEDVALSPSPFAIALDLPSGMVYWTNTVDRVIRRASIAGALPAAPSDVVAIGHNVGERVPDGPGASAGFSSWTRIGAPGVTALPYQIKLTGAGFQYAQTMLVKGNQRVAGVGDAIGNVASSVLSIIDGAGGPIRLTDRGDVLWTGQYLAPSIYINHSFSGFFFNQDLLITSDQAPPIINASAQSLVYLYDGPHAFDASSDGTYALISANLSTAPFVQPDHALLFQFQYAATGACCTDTACAIVGGAAACTGGGSYQGDATVCGTVGNPTTCCPANFDGLNGVTVSDIFSFLTAWFAGNPSANFDHVNGVTVADIFAFLTAWFHGC